MKTVKVYEATGPALDWLVAKCEGEDYLPEVSYDGIGNEYPATRYSTNWSQGGPIIEREQIDLTFICPGTWRAADTENWFNGPTPLIAAMRCYVASKLGNEVEVPEELA